VKNGDQRARSPFRREQVTAELRIVAGISRQDHDVETGQIDRLVGVRLDAMSKLLEADGERRSHPGSCRNPAVADENGERLLRPLASRHRADRAQS
jgi:hypothetical protein